MGDHTIEQQNSRIKHARNVKTLQVAQSLIDGDFDITKPIRIICECASYLCRELVTIPGDSFNARGVRQQFYIVPSHVVDPAMVTIRKADNYHLVGYK